MWMLPTRRRYAESYAKSRNLILNQGTFVFGRFEQLEEAAFKSLGKEVTAEFVEASASFSRFVAERDGMNDRTIQMPPVMPHQLVHPHLYAFCGIVGQHRERLVER
jgi:hypothetical protein